MAAMVVENLRFAVADQRFEAKEAREQAEGSNGDKCGELMPQQAKIQDILVDILVDIPVDVLVNIPVDILIDILVDILDIPAGKDYRQQ